MYGHAKTSLLPDPSSQDVSGVSRRRPINAHLSALSRMKQHFVSARIDSELLGIYTAFEIHKPVPDI